MRTHKRVKKPIWDNSNRIGKTARCYKKPVNAWELGFATPQLKHIVEMSNIFGTTVDNILNASSKVVIDISDLSEKEQQAIFNIVDCFKAQHNNKTET